LFLQQQLPSHSPFSYIKKFVQLKNVETELGNFDHAVGSDAEALIARIRAVLKGSQE